MGGGGQIHSRRRRRRRWGRLRSREEPTYLVGAGAAVVLVSEEKGGY
jgi:hypothetical protein